MGVGFAIKYDQIVKHLWLPLILNDLIFWDKSVMILIMPFHNNLKAEPLFQES
jgi:hypothetical protein